MPARQEHQGFKRDTSSSPSLQQDGGATTTWKKYSPLLWWIALIIILYFAIGLKTGAVGEKTCPDKTNGPAFGNANLTILYFGNPFCVYCWIEDPILERLSERHKNVMRYEHYDNRYCINMTQAYGIYAVPGFVFKTSSGNIATHTGFLTETYLSQVICETTGSCGGSS